MIQGIGVPSRWFMSQFELVRTDAAEMAVTSGPIVERVDVIRYVRDR